MNTKLAIKVLLVTLTTGLMTGCGSNPPGSSARTAPSRAPLGGAPRDPAATKKEAQRLVDIAWNRGEVTRERFDEEIDNFQQDLREEDPALMAAIQELAEVKRTKYAFKPSDMHIAHSRETARQLIVDKLQDYYIDFYDDRDSDFIKAWMEPCVSSLTAEYRAFETALEAMGRELLEELRQRTEMRRRYDGGSEPTMMTDVTNRAALN